MKAYIDSVDFGLARFRTPFQFGAGVMQGVSTVRVVLRLQKGGRESTGVGAMTLGNGWSFPSAAPDVSAESMKRLVRRLAQVLDGVDLPDSILDASARFEVVAQNEAANISREMADLGEPIPPLCALVCASAFDMALFDAWGHLNEANTFSLLRSETQRSEQLARLGLSQEDLKSAIAPRLRDHIDVFHAVGGADPLRQVDVVQAVGDGLPEHLEEWIRRDGVTHFKVKLLGHDPEWDYQRVVEVDRVSSAVLRASGRSGSDVALSLDMNEQWPSGEALEGFLRHLQRSEPDTFNRLKYVEQPTPRSTGFPGQSNVTAAARLKPILLDEGLTSFEALDAALDAGYSGFCLKACKGIGFSILAAAVGHKRGLQWCVQDLTCTGVALLASVAMTAWLGANELEYNSRQYCPTANEAEAAVYPEVFGVKDGRIETSRLDGPGLGFD